jgi:hypothetical protein
VGRPDRTFAYSDANWKEIESCLAQLDIDADTLTVGDRWWAQPYPATALLASPQRPLREQLQEMAADYRGLSRWRKEGYSLTPKQEAAEIQKALNALDRAYRTLNSSRVGIVYFDLRAWPPVDHNKPGYEAGAACAAMRALTIKLKRYHDKLTALGHRSGANARKVHIEYWGELVVLWKAITAGQEPRGGLSHFLFVCSSPTFPEETTQDHIRNFLNKRSLNKH